MMSHDVVIYLNIITLSVLAGSVKLVVTLFCKVLHKRCAADPSVPHIWFMSCWIFIRQSGGDREIGVLCAASDTSVADFVGSTDDPKELSRVCLLCSGKKNKPSADSRYLINTTDAVTNTLPSSFIRCCEENKSSVNGRLFSQKPLWLLCLDLFQCFSGQNIF